MLSDNLEAGGSTAGGAGLRLAYSVASENLVKGGNNRIMRQMDILMWENRATADGTLVEENCDRVFS